MKEIELTDGNVALIDDADYEMLNQCKWYAAKGKLGNFYAAGKGYADGKQTTILMHRFIMGISDPKILIDHIDGNGLNNQRNNLRISTYSQNNANRSSRKDSSSKYIGVDRYNKTGKWRVEIQKDGKRNHIGYFLNEEDAAKAYNDAAIKYHGEFARLNIILS